MKKVDGMTAPNSLLTVYSSPVYARFFLGRTLHTDLSSSISYHATRLARIVLCPFDNYKLIINVFMFFY